jgi:hypothetical protein
VSGYSETETLLELADGACLFHTPDGEAYVRVRVKEGREALLVESEAFRRWLTGAYWNKHRRATSSKSLGEAQSILAAKAQFEGPEARTFLRTAALDGKLYLDLAEDERRVVELSPAGWRILADAPVAFRRSPGMLALPVPVSGCGGAAVGNLRPLLNVKREDDWRLLISWLLFALSPTGPYPVLVLQGEQGSAKTMTARLLRDLIDPSTASLRSCPSSDRDIMISAVNSWVVSYDNLSYLGEKACDAICRLSTGAGFTTRKLYSDSEEAIFAACRPIILNGIPAVATRQDLLDRAIVIELEPILAGRRVPEGKLLADYTANRPLILGSLLDAFCCALGRVDQLSQQRLPRMADFARFVTAAEPALGWDTGAFMQAYEGNRTEAVALSIDNDPLAQALLSMHADCGFWSGTATDLLKKLQKCVDTPTQRTAHWPGSAHALSHRLARIQPALRMVGVDVTWSRKGHDGTRIVSVGPMCSRADDADAADASFQDEVESRLNPNK